MGSRDGPADERVPIIFVASLCFRNVKNEVLEPQFPIRLYGSLPSKQRAEFR